MHPTACLKLPVQGDLLVSLQQPPSGCALESFLGVWQASPDAICVLCPTAELLNWQGADQWLLERCITGSKGMQHFLTFVRGTAGEHSPFPASSAWQDPGTELGARVRCHRKLWKVSQQQSWEGDA